MKLSDQERDTLREACRAAEKLEIKVLDVLRKHLVRKPTNREEKALFNAWFHQGSVAKNIRIVLGEEGVVDEP